MSPLSAHYSSRLNDTELYLLWKLLAVLPCFHISVVYFFNRDVHTTSLISRSLMILFLSNHILEVYFVKVFLFTALRVMSNQVLLFLYKQVWERGASVNAVFFFFFSQSFEVKATEKKANQISIAGVNMAVS